MMQDRLNELTTLSINCEIDKTRLHYYYSRFYWQKSRNCFIGAHWI